MLSYIHLAPSPRHAFPDGIHKLSKTIPPQNSVRTMSEVIEAPSERFAVLAEVDCHGMDHWLLKPCRLLISLSLGSTPRIAAISAHHRPWPKFQSRSDHLASNLQATCEHISWRHEAQARHPGHPAMKQALHPEVQIPGQSFLPSSFFNWSLKRCFW